MSINGEGVTEICFKVQNQNYIEDTEENHARHQSGYPTTRRRFEPYSYLLCARWLQQWRLRSDGHSAAIHVQDDTSGYEIFIGSWDLMDRCYQNRNSAGEEIKVKSNKVPLQTTS